MNDHHGWGGATPIFRVRDVRASIRYFIDMLGFTLDWDTPKFVSVSRDHCCIFLCEADQSAERVWVWIGCPDAGALHDELRAKGAIIRHPPTDHPWAYEFQVADLDGNVMRIGSEPRKGEPEREWLDGSGRLWVRQPSGRWEESAAE
ncbi:MAG: VOC family protein [Candidatus Eisenbacteria bacterium]|nr:VOC family protein [Candidatus Eisenbacteria bacterium]